MTRERNHAAEADAYFLARAIADEEPAKCSDCGVVMRAGELDEDGLCGECAERLAADRKMSEAHP